jgi:hypothetical protein
LGLNSELLVITIISDPLLIIFFTSLLNLTSPPVLQKVL